MCWTNKYQSTKGARWYGYSNKYSFIHARFSSGTFSCGSFFPVLRICDECYNMLVRLKN